MFGQKVLVNKVIFQAARRALKGYGYLEDGLVACFAKVRW
jgi:hypothetical protein